MIDEMIRIAVEAADVLRERSKHDFTVQYKGIGDPVTVLDRELNTMICDALARSFPEVPIVAEEGDSSTWDVRNVAPEVFFVDPIDGTRELIARNGEFSVMIGFARGSDPVGGVIVWPARGRTFAAWEGDAFEIASGARKPIHVAEPPADVRVLVSRSHPDAKSAALLDRMGVEDRRPLGSLGLKVALVACGEADAYVHVGMRGGGKLWDACAPDAILRAAGGRFTDSRGAPIDYRGTLGLEFGLLAASPDVHARMLSALQG